MPALGGLFLVSKLLALVHLVSVITVVWHPVDLGLAGLCVSFHVLAVPNNKAISRPHKEHYWDILIFFLVQDLMAMIIQKYSCSYS